MMKKLTILILLQVISALAYAESWDYIRTSGEYYYGVGIGATEEEADKAALANLVSQIATNVSADFTQIDDVTTHNGNVDHKSRVLNCVNTYSQSTLTNTEKWGPEGKAPNITVKRYMKKSELSRIFANRIDKAKNMLEIADDCLENKKIDMALQYYYWAYSLVRSVQFPNEVKDARGRSIIDWIPVKIDQILRDINVSFDNKDGDFTNLIFTYQNNPVSSLEFSYSDGRSLCQGLAKDGRGIMEMLPGYETDIYHIDIEYQYKSLARGDSEMQSVLDVITPKIFQKAAVSVDSRIANNSKKDLQSTSSRINPTFDNRSNDLSSNIEEEVKVSAPISSVNRDVQSKCIEGIVSAITNRRYLDVSNYFTVEGLQLFNRLTNYGKCRVLDASNLRYFEGLNGHTVVRGLKMSFSFTGKRKKTFVEDISFTFNDDNKIENVAFGLGDIAENGIFNSRASWNGEVREIIVSFMENYKTAYSLERLDYIREIFDDNATIIIGNKIRKTPNNLNNTDGSVISLSGQNLIKYNRYTKDEYIAKLARCFNRNDFINLRLTNHQIQWLEKFEDRQLFAINIRQEYDSSLYADDGYLFLLVDMTDKEEPLIQVRTWQPNEVSIDKLYNAGDFFNN